MDRTDRKIIRYLQGQFPLTTRPYAYIAEQIGVEEAVVLERLQRMKEQKQIRKMGAVLRHRRIGYHANGLCVWKVDLQEADRIGALMITHPAVTHCYSRPAAADWPYTMYTMLHGQDRASCVEFAKEISAITGIGEYEILFSTKEWKKTSMRYFDKEEEL